MRDAVSTAGTRVVMLLCLTSTVAPAQTPPSSAQPAPVFRSATRLVTQVVTVTDKNGRPITGLTPADFVVTENGRVQQVAFAEFQSVGEAEAPSSGIGLAAGRTGGMRSAENGIAVPAQGDAGYQNRRLLVLYFDRSSMPIADQGRAYAAARKYLDTAMGPSDLLAVMVFSGGAVRVQQEFTDDREALREAIEWLASGGDRNGDGVPDEAEMGSAFGENDAEFNMFSTDRQLAALQTAAAMLRPLPQRKALVYFGSGFRLNGSDNRAQLRATVNAAVRANVTINPVDARGLVAFAPGGDATRPAPGGAALFSGTLADALQARFQRSQDTLYALARDTGGLPLLDQNDLSVGIVQAAQALTSYYILGYYTTHTEPDGRFRRVKVALTLNIAADLAYRDGYFGDKTFAKFTDAEKERQLEEALKLDDPITEIGIAAELNYFQLNRNEYFVPVSVRLPGNELTLARRRGAARTVIDAIGEVKDDHGITHRNVRDRLDIRLDDEESAQLATRPVHYETGFTLLPGRYVLKVLVRDATTGRIGTYETPFEVPNLELEATRLPISSVVLSGLRIPEGAALHEVRQKGRTTPSPLVQGGERLIPSVARTFAADRDLDVFLQAYPPAEVPAVLAYVSVFSDGAKVLETHGVVCSRPVGRSRAIDIRLRIPQGALEAGSYIVQLVALDPHSRTAAFWRGAITVVGRSTSGRQGSAR